MNIRFILKGFFLISTLVGTAASYATTPNVPNIKGMTYHEARKAVMEAGWKPLPFAGQIDPFGQVHDFNKAGYTEVESCSQGASFCSFYFTDDKGVKLHVVTAGEEGKYPDGTNYYARVDNYRVLIESFGLPIILKETASNTVLEEKTKQAKQEAIWAEIIKKSNKELQDWCIPISNRYEIAAESREIGVPKEYMIAQVLKTTPQAKDKTTHAQMLIIIDRAYGEFAYYTPASVKVLAMQECININQADFKLKAEQEYFNAIKDL